MSEKLCEVIDDQVSEVIIDNHLTLADERSAPVPAATYGQVLADVIVRSKGISSSVPEQDTMVGIMLNRVRAVTGDDTFDAERLAKAIRVTRARKQSQRTTGRLYY